MRKGKGFSNDMKILIASPEAVPFIKTGGLADVVGALLKEYKKIGIDADIILPLYKKIKTADRHFQLQSLNKRITVPIGDSLEEGKLWKGQTPGGVTAYFIEND
ncbi:MAG TPA: starch synthase, partial [Nitrospiraceae bacterium]|nr:starch synthase [Nitrospiraceae bacterium]